MAGKNAHSFRLIWGILMVIIYLGMSYLLVITPFFKQYSPLLRYIFGGIFLAYGIFRAWKIWSNKP